MIFGPLTAAAVAFLTIACLEGWLVTVWRWLESYREEMPILAQSPKPIDRRQLRRQVMFWIGALVLCEGLHDAIRTAYYVLRLNPWPIEWSFFATFGECVAAVGLIRVLTRSACGEWGWTVACILPAIVAAAAGLR